MPVGTLWLHALQMTVVPFVISLIIVGVTQAADVAAGGRIARRALTWIILLASASSVFTALVAPALFAACPRSGDVVSAIQPGGTIESGAAIESPAPVQGPATVEITKSAAVI
jgi:Na+/H+-dicarboxylate symporter